jgi:hypothetical protein
VHGTDRIAFHDAGFNLGAAEGTGTALAKLLPAGLFSPNTNGSFAAAGNRFAYNTHPALTASDLYFVA